MIFVQTSSSHHLMNINLSRKKCPVIKGRLSRTSSSDSTHRHGIVRHRAGRTLHKTRGLTAIRAPETIRLSCCSDKLLQVTLVCACGSKMYQNASPTLPVKPIGWKRDASEGAYGIPHHVWNRAVREGELILTIILKALDAQQSGSVMKHDQVPCSRNCHTHTYCQWSLLPMLFDILHPARRLVYFPHRLNV